MAITMPNLNNLRLAVLIDAENVPRNCIKKVMEEIAIYGTPTVKRIYGDWTSPMIAGWKTPLLENAITPVQQYSYTTGKNSSDSAMIIDAMDILYSEKTDGFVIVSSDSDFTRLAIRLREAGQRVIGIGERKTPSAFIAACDKFTYIEVIRAGGNRVQLEQDDTKPEKEDAQPAGGGPKDNVNAQTTGSGVRKDGDSGQPTGSGARKDSDKGRQASGGARKDGEKGRQSGSGKRSAGKKPPKDGDGGQAADGMAQVTGALATDVVAQAGADGALATDVVAQAGADGALATGEVPQLGADGVLAVGEASQPYSVVVQADGGIATALPDNSEADQNQGRQQSDKGASLTKQRGSRVPSSVVDLIADSVSDLAGDDGTVFMGELGNLIQKKQPDFDHRNFGYKSLSAMIKSIDRFEIDFRQTTDPNIKHVFVRDKES